MDSIMLGIKFLMFYALEFVVIALVVAVVVGGVVQVYRRRARQLRTLAPAPEKRVISR